MWTTIFVILGFVLGFVLTAVVEIKVVKCKGGTFVLSIVSIICFTLTICICGYIGNSIDGINPSGSSSYSVSSSTCHSCDRSFSDDTNKNYIRWTNMCRKCYRNYCYAKGITPSNYDK